MFPFIQGTQGWSDKSLEKCRKFYPSGVTSSTEKLSFYSRSGGFGCVEVDSSAYAITSQQHVKKWIMSTPKDFIFHFKAFGALCKNITELKMFPKSLQSQIGRGSVLITDLSYDLQQQIWKLFNDSLLPAFEASKLGLIVFQFNLGFVPSPEAFEYLNYCSAHLHSQYRMGIDFRNRAWIQEGPALKLTLAFLRGLGRKHGTCLIASDDLEHELYFHKKLKPGDEIRKMPTVLTSQAGMTDYLYVRIHRREGIKRVLSDEELCNWSKCIKKAYDDEDFKGTVFVLWGTDHENQPIINSLKLLAALPIALQFDWRSHSTKSVAWYQKRKIDKELMEDEIYKKSKFEGIKGNNCLILGEREREGEGKEESEVGLEVQKEYSGDEIKEIELHTSMVLQDYINIKNAEQERIETMEETIRISTCGFSLNEIINLSSRALRIRQHAELHTATVEADD